MGPMLAACLRFDREVTGDVLTFDLGGGTTDVSLLRVTIGRDLQRRRTTVETRLLGVTGDPAFGGDNVSLELVRLVRAKVAVEAARALVADAQAQAGLARAAEGLDIFDRILQGGAAPVAARRTGDGEDDELAPPPLERRLGLARAIAARADAILRAAAEGVREHPAAAEGKDAFVEHLRDLLRADAHERGQPFDAAEAERLADALERLLPTRFARHADQDPLAERRAKVFFMDLWRECNDRLKPLLVARAAGDPSPAAAAAAEARVQEPLERIARWLGVDAKLFSDRVSVTLAELDRMIEPRLRRLVARARDLYLGAVDAGPDGAPPVDDAARPLEAEPPPLVSTSAHRRPAAVTGPVRPPLTVLLTGNASILPALRRAFADVLRGVEHQLVWDERTRKTSVAQGAVEEQLLAQEFGREGGGVHYRTVDFLERLPFSIGLYSRFVGFRPLFQRGAREGDMVLVDARSNELVQRDATELPLFADYHDGAPVRYLGTLELGQGGRDATLDELEAMPPAEQDEDGQPVFQVLLRLLRDWDVELLDPETGRVHGLAIDPGLDLDPRDDPLSGVH